MTRSRLTVGLENVVAGLDPTTSRLDIPSMVCALAVYDTLAAYSPEGQVLPYLAERLETSADYQSWTIGLRPAVRLHDGSYLDAALVKDNLDRHRASPLTGAVLRDVAETSVVDPLTVRVDLRAPWAVFPAYLTGQIGLVAGRSVLEGGATPVGTGPFRFVDREADRINMVRHDSHWRPLQPGFDAITFETVIEPAKRLEGVLNGRLDLAHTTDAATIKALRGHASVLTVTSSGGATDTGCVMLNTARPPLDDLVLRRALAHALDRATIVERIFGGIVPVASSPFGSRSPFAYDPPYPAFDPARARDLVAEHMRRSGEQPRIRFGTTTTKKNLETARMIAEMWNAVGISTEIQQTPQDEFIWRALLGDFEAFEWHQFGAGDPDENSIFWDEDTVADIGQLSLNMPRNRDALLSAALRKGRQTRDFSVRQSAYREVAERLASTLPYLWINETPYALLHRRGLASVGGATFPDGMEAFGLAAGRFRVGEIREEAAL